jgi:fumarate hydratase class II
MRPVENSLKKKQKKFNSGIKKKKTTIKKHSFAIVLDQWANSPHRTFDNVKECLETFLAVIFGGVATGV